FHGMLKGAAMYYDEEIEVDTLETREGFTRVEITFQNEIYTEKSYKFNKFFSFGCIRKLELKIALGTLIFGGIPMIILSQFVDNKVFIPVSLLLAFFVPYLIGKGLVKPMEDILLSIEEIKNKDLSLERNISTKDLFEDMKDRKSVV